MKWLRVSCSAGLRGPQGGEAREAAAAPALKITPGAAAARARTLLDVAAQLRRHRERHARHAGLARGSGGAARAGVAGRRGACSAAARAARAAPHEVRSGATPVWGVRQG